MPSTFYRVTDTFEQKWFLNRLLWTWRHNALSVRVMTETCKKLSYLAFGKTFNNVLTHNSKPLASDTYVHLVYFSYVCSAPSARIFDLIKFHILLLSWTQCKILLSWICVPSLEQFCCLIGTLYIMLSLKWLSRKGRYSYGFLCRTN